MRAARDITNRPMADTLRQAYDQPDRRRFFYTARNRQTASARLNAMPYWDWSPDAPETCEFQTPPYMGGTYMLARDFGAPPRVVDDCREWVWPFIHDPAQVKDIRVPDLHEGRMGDKLRHARELKTEFQAKGLWTPDTCLGLGDIQSPLGQAELMWDQSFYIALVEHPAAVHELLEKLTEYLIRHIHAMYEIIGEGHINPTCCPPLWAQRKRGFYLSDDTMSLLSPEMHHEFSITYLNWIIDACGPVSYHSCSWYPKYFDNLHELKDVLVHNWNPGNSCDPALIIREFSGEAVLAPHIVHGMHKDRDVLTWNPNFQDEAEFVRYFLDNLQDTTTMYMWFSNIAENGPVMEKIYDMLDERGWSPQACGVS